MTNTSNGVNSYYGYGYGYGYSNKTDFTNIVRNENNAISVNKDLLLELYSIQSPSRDEVNIIEFLYKYIKSNHDDVTIKVEKNGNMLITKGVLNKNESYPCIVAHLDEVHSKDPNRLIVGIGGFIIGFNQKTGEREGIGADDKNGIYVALEMLKVFPKLKVFFSVGEEIGLVGSKEVDLEFFNNVGYMLQCDRRGHTNLITKTNGITVTSDEFIYEIYDIMEQYGYSEETGTSTDIGGLKNRGVNVSACNISCGYWDEHTGDELCYIPALENCLNFVYHILHEVTYSKFEHIGKSYYTTNYNYRRTNNVGTAINTVGSLSITKNNTIVDKSLGEDGEEEEDLETSRSKYPYHSPQNSYSCENCRTFDCMTCIYG